MRDPSDISEHGTDRSQTKNTKERQREKTIKTKQNKQKKEKKHNRRVENSFPAVHSHAVEIQTTSEHLKLAISF